MFLSYLELGLRHILDPQAYDHIMFVVSLCIIYHLSEWKKVLVLVTAFTVGHSLTLALSAMDMVNFDPSIIEMLIPITIICSAAINLFMQRPTNKYMKMQYLIALVFGFVHGLGFSNYLKSILDREESIIGPLLSFNIGIEIGQIFIVLGTMFLTYLATDILKINRKYFISTVLIFIILISIRLMFS